MKQLIVSYSTYVIDCDGHTTHAATFSEAERKHRNAKSREGTICYLYRLDFTEAGKLIETYMIG